VQLSKTNVAAPPEKVFALLEDFHNWPKWSPHEKTDPAVRRTYAGAPKGAGALYEWDGNGPIGAGRAQITTANAPGELVVDFDIKRPVVGKLALRFSVEPGKDGTQVSVTTDGPSDLVKHVMGMLFQDNNLILLSCAAGGSPEFLCSLFQKRDLVDKP
jgi:uncharacterized protein YndB with AHSA1/START domain